MRPLQNCQLTSSMSAGVMRRSSVLHLRSKVGFVFPLSNLCGVPYDQLMSTPILVTKLFVPTPRPKMISRPRLIERLNEGLQCNLTLISAPAGFGKTTLVSEWVADCERPVAWLSLDEADNDPARFLTYLIAALQTIAATLGEGVLGVLQSPQPPPPEAMLTALLNDLTTILDDFVLVLDDYHV